MTRGFRNHRQAALKKAGFGKLAGGRVEAGKAVAGEAAAGKAVAGKAVAGKIAAGKIAAGKTGMATTTAAAAATVVAGKPVLAALALAGVVAAGVGLVGGRHAPQPQPQHQPIPRIGRGITMATIANLFRGKIVLLVLTLLSLVLLALGLFPLYRWHTKSYDIVIAAGSSKAESYVLMSALKVVASRYYPRINIAVIETGGTVESLAFLERGAAQLAVVQADIPPGPSARTVAVLFQDNFQLLAHRASRGDNAPAAAKRNPSDRPAMGLTDNSPLTHFSDLKGKRIALPKAGGQFRSFLFVASHFGLRESDFTFVGGDDDAADLAFARNEADAIFQVRSLHNAAIAQLVTGGYADFIPIEDASAMHEMSPAYMPASIPKGTYLGTPPVPPVDLPTVGTLRVLLSRTDVDDEVIYALTEVLMQHRGELSAAIRSTEELVRPLVSHSARPAPGSGADAPVHPGAIAFYNRDQGSFVSGHADLLAWMVSAFLLLCLWLVELRSVFRYHHKHRSDQYNHKIMLLMEEAEQAPSGQELDAIHSELISMMALAIRDLGRDKLSAQSFESFHTIWQIATDAVRRREAALRREGRHRAGREVALPVDNAEQEWSLPRFMQPRN